MIANLKINTENNVLYISNFLSNFSFFSMLGILTLYFTVHCQFSLHYSGILMFFVLVFSRTGRIIFLPLFKKFQPKSVLIISAILMSAGYGILYITKIKIAMLVAFLCIGVGYGCNSVYVRTLVSSALQTNRIPTKLIYAKLSVITNLSAAIGGLVGVYVFLHLSAHYVFLYASISVLMSALIISASFVEDKVLLNNISMFMAICFIFKRENILSVFLMTILSWALYIQIFSTFPLLINNQLHAAKFLGILYALNTIIIVFFSIPITKYLLKFTIDLYFLIIIAYLLFGIGFLFLYLLPNLITTFISMTLWTLAEILMVPALNSAISELTKESERLYLFAFNGVAMGLGEGIGMYAGTMLTGMQLASQVNQTYLYLFILAFLFLGIVIIIKNSFFLFKKQGV